jgi:hypothetical protein
MALKAQCALLTLTAMATSWACSTSESPDGKSHRTMSTPLKAWTGVRFEQVLRVNPGETDVRNRCELTIDLRGPARPLTFIATAGPVMRSVGWKGPATSNGKLTISGCASDPCEVTATWQTGGSNGSVASCMLIADDGTVSHNGTSTGTALTVNGAPSFPVIFNQDAKLHTSTTAIAGHCIFRQSAALLQAQVTDLGVVVNGGQVLDVPGPTAIGNVPFPTNLGAVAFGTIYVGGETDATRLKHVTPIKEQLDSSDALRCKGRYHSSSGVTVFDINLSASPVGTGMSIARGETGWTCAVSKFGTGDGCDCNCGILDPDCVIEPCDTGQPGICAAGTTACGSGTLSCVQDNESEPLEICGNGLDDDCDGQDDNGCTCSAGAYNCDGLAGCECSVGSGCCGGNCETEHDNGLGQNFYDCESASTYNVNQALAACAAFTGDIAQCVDYGVTCDANDDLIDDTAVVCGDSSVVGDCACWAYSGTAIGYVFNEPGGNNCFCPLVGDPQWD